MGVFRRQFHRGPRSRRRQVVAGVAAAPAAVSTVVRRRKVPDHVYRRPDLSIYSRTWRRALAMPSGPAAVIIKPIERRPVPPHVYDRPDMTEFSRRRRRLAPRRVVAATVAEACRLSFVGVEREPLEIVANTTDAVDATFGRAALEIVGVWCREDI